MNLDASIFGFVTFCHLAPSEILPTQLRPFSPHTKGEMAQIMFHSNSNILTIFDGYVYAMEYLALLAENALSKKIKHRSMGSS